MAVPAACLLLGAFPSRTARHLSERQLQDYRRLPALHCLDIQDRSSVRGCSPEERLAACQAQSVPLVDDFRLWLTHQRNDISTRSRLGEKLGYIYCHQDGLYVFLTDGRVDINTSPFENTIRPITFHRKNALFAGHDKGGRTQAHMALFIETFKLNAVDPYAPMRETPTVIALRYPALSIDDLMQRAIRRPSN